MMTLAGIRYEAFLQQGEQSRRSAMSVRLAALLSCLLMTVEVALVSEEDDKKEKKDKKGKKEKRDVKDAEPAKEETPRVIKLKKICHAARCVIMQLVCSAQLNSEALLPESRLLGSKAASILDAKTVKALSDSLVALCKSMPGKKPLYNVGKKDTIPHSSFAAGSQLSTFKLQSSQLQSLKPASASGSFEPSSSLPAWVSQPSAKWPYLVTDPEEQFNPTSVYGTKIDLETRRSQAAVIIQQCWHR